MVFKSFSFSGPELLALYFGQLFFVSLSLSYTHKVICIHMDQIRANQIIKSNHIKTSNQIESNNIMLLLFILSFLIFLSKARIIWRSSPYYYFETAKTAWYHPNTGKVTRLTWQTINSPTETQQSIKIFPTSKSPNTFPEELNEKTVFGLRFGTATNETMRQDGTWCYRKRSADIANCDNMAEIRV
jgi:hypothetical protein